MYLVTTCCFDNHLGWRCKFVGGIGGIQFNAFSQCISQCFLYRLKVRSTLFTLNRTGFSLKSMFLKVFIAASKRDVFDIVESKREKGNAVTRMTSEGMS